MNGKIQISHVKNETTYNIPLVLEENVISSGISLLSLWHTLADESYRVSWPRDKKKPLIANSWVAIYTEATALDRAGCCCIIGAA